MHCRYCNAELMAGAVFCAQCGRLVAAGSTEFSSCEGNPYDQPVPQPEPYRSSPPDYTKYPQPEYGLPQSPYPLPGYGTSPPPYVPPPAYVPQQVYMQQTYAPQQQEPGRTAALLGFIFSLGSLLFPPLFIPGLILSIIGLKSRSRHRLALAGLIISIIVLLLMCALLSLSTLNGG
jgi:hypothetical protein